MGACVCRFCVQIFRHHRPPAPPPPSKAGDGRWGTALRLTNAAKEARDHKENDQGQSQIQQANVHGDAR